MHARPRGAPRAVAQPSTLLRRGGRAALVGVIGLGLAASGLSACVASPDAAREAVIDARRAGAEAGAATTENGCVRAAVERIGVCGQLAFECQTQALAFAEACFAAARPSVRACRDLPPVRPDEHVATHRARLTRHAGTVCRDLGRASVQACTQVLVVLEQHCTSTTRLARVRTGTVATTTTATVSR